MGLGSLQRCAVSRWEETRLVRTQLWLTRFPVVQMGPGFSLGPVSWIQAKAAAR